MEVFLTSIATQEYESMASALIEMGATNKDVDARAFSKDLEKMFSSLQARTFKINLLFYFKKGIFSETETIINSFL